MGIVFKRICVKISSGVRHYSSTKCKVTHKCRLLVVGAGTGGCSVASRFARRLRDRDIIVLEPSQYHYYQPLFTLVAAGVRKLGASRRPTQAVLPRNVVWIRDHAEVFDPCNCTVHTRGGDRICYDFMVVALGVQNEYDTIPGLKKALDDPKSGVCTIYSPQYCDKTWRHIKNFRGGHAIYTFPIHGGKCAGAAQKIMYLSDDYWRRQKLRNIASLTYVTGGDAIFGVPKYAKALTEVACNRNIAVNRNMELAAVTKEGAEFRAGDKMITLPYNFLHVTPYMCPPRVLKRCPLLAPEGYLDVDKHTLQHSNYSNVYGIGDCTTTPNSKTAAAVGVQSHIVEQNLINTMFGKAPTAQYDGYGACPMLTSYKRGILAEFGYDKKLKETFPFDQSKERRILNSMTKYVFPYLYWNHLLTGKWNGPAGLRKFMNPLGRN